MLNIPNDSILAKHLSVDLRKRLQSEGGSIIELNDPSGSVIEIPICQTSTTTDILLDGSVTVIDGINVSECNFILIKDQTDKSENGIYFNDFTRWDGLVGGMLIIVQKGTTNELTYWKNINTEIIYGNDIEFELFGSSLPLGTEGQTLRYNASDELEANSKLVLLDDSNTMLTNNGTYSATVKTYVDAGSSEVYLNAEVLRLDNNIDNTGKYLRIANEDSEVEFVDISPLPTGTVTDSSLRWNGTAWVENTKVLLTAVPEIIAYYSSGNNALLKANATTAYVGANLGTYSYFLGYAGTTEALKIVIAGGEVFLVNNSGTIKSNSLTANTILRANSSKEIVSVTNGTNDQVLTTDGVSIYSFKDRVTDRLSFLAADQTFTNLAVTPPTDPPITTYAELGDYGAGTTFKVSLLSGRRYEFELRLLIDNTLDTKKDFQIKLTMPSAWSTQLFTEKSYEWIINQFDISVLTYNYDKIIEVPKNTELAFVIDNEDGSIYASTLDLYVKGVIDTPTTAGNVTLDVRNIMRDAPDGTIAVTFKQGSYMKANECKIN